MNPPPAASRRVLEPSERISEVLFGLIMVLTFTGSLSVAEAGREDIRTMLVGALGCNLAWGIIDAVFYLMGSLAEKGRDLAIFRAVRTVADPREAQRLIAEALPPVIASVVRPPELDAMHQRLQQLPEPPGPARLSGSDWRGAAGVFLLVFLSTFPVAVPFIVMQDAMAGHARLQRRRRRDAVRRRRGLRARRRAVAVGARRRRWSRWARCSSR